MKTRRKTELTAQKRDRMRTGGGPSRPSPEPSTSAAQDAMLVDEDALTELTDVELNYAIDSDSVIPSTGIQEESATPDEPQTVFVVLQDSIEESREVQSEEVQTENLNPVASEAPPGTGQRRSVERRTSSRLSDFNRHSSGGRNIRAQIIQEEFTLREDSYKRAQEREEELHKLKLAEREWLVKAAEETYKKACLERQAAQLVLDNLKHK